MTETEQGNADTEEMLPSEGAAGTPETGTPGTARTAEAGTLSSGAGTPQKPVSAHSIFSPNAEGKTASWTDTLPEELRGNAELRKFKDANEALKSYTNLVSLAGKKGLKAPAPDAGEAAWNAYFTARRGGVEAPESYTTKYDAKAMVGLDEEVFNVMSRYMFMHGFSDVEHAKAMELVGALREREADLWEQENARRCAECERDLRDEWGAKYDANINSVRAFVQKFPEAARKLQAYGLENDVHMCRMLLCAAERVAESKAPQTPEVSATSAKDLEARIEKLMKSKAYQDEKSAGHKLAQEQFMDLMVEKAKLRSAGML